MRSALCAIQDVLQPIIQSFVPSFNFLSFSYLNYLIFQLNQSKKFRFKIKFKATLNHPINQPSHSIVINSHSIVIHCHFTKVIARLPNKISFRANQCHPRSIRAAPFNHSSIHPFNSLFSPFFPLKHHIDSHNMSVLGGILFYHKRVINTDF